MGGVSVILRKILSDPVAGRPRHRSAARPQSELVLLHGAP